MENEHYQRKPDKDSFEYWREVVETLEKGRMTKDPFIHEVCKICWESGGQYYKPLKQALESRPGLLAKAKRNVAEQEEKPFWPPPMKPDEIKKINGAYKLGYVNSKNDMAGLDSVDFTQILVSYGVPKTGKTYLNTFISDQLLGTPDKKFNMIAVDRKRDYVHLIKKHPNLVILKTENIRFNVFEEKEGWLDAVQVISDENYFGASSQPVIEQAYKECLIENGLLVNGKFQNSENYPNYSQILKRLLQITGKLKGAHYRDIESKITARFGQYIRTEEVFNCKKGFPLDFWLNNDIIIVPDGMNRTEIRSFIIGLAHRVFRHYKKHNMRGDQLRTLFLLDEGGWLLDAKRDTDMYITNEALDDVLRMGREFGLGWMISAQQPNMVCKTVRENARFIVSFRVQSNSMDEVQKDVGLNDEQKDYMKHKFPPKLTGIFSTPNFTRPILFWMEEAFHIEKDVSDKYIDRKMHSVIEHLHAELKDSEAAKFVDIDRIRKQSTIQIAGLLILDQLKQNRFSHYTEIRDKRKLGNKMDEALSWLESEGLVVVIGCKHNKKGHTAKYLTLTATAQNSLNVPEKERISPSHFKHTLYQERVKAWIEAQGYVAIKEYCAEGAFKERIDVYTEYQQNGLTEKVAYEITLTLNSKDIMKNVTKCLNYPFSVDEINLVCETKEDLDRTIALVAKSEQILPSPLEKITFCTITDFL